jgi:deoxyribonuclease-2
MFRLFWVALLPAVTAYQCLDENGKGVEWWIALKHPDGGFYSYLDVHAPTDFKRSLYDLNSAKGGAITDTVKQLYAANATDGVAVYNDDTDEGHQLASHAHAKGVAVFNTQGGFWMVHSLPKWPNRRSKGYNGLSSDRYGQAFLCLSLDASVFDDVGKLWATNWVQFYDINVPAAIAKKLPNFASAVNGDKSGQITENFYISTAQTKFLAFAKDKTWAKNLYGDFVAPTLKSDLVVETWQNGRGSMPSNCSGTYTIENVAIIKTIEGDSWTINQDHSKWTITRDGNVQVACVGDINRQVSQAGRGGGTVCIDNKDVWGAFNRVIATVEKCK